MQGDLTFVALVGDLRRLSSTLALANTLDELAPDDVEVTVLESVGFLPHFNADLLRGDAPRAVLALQEAVGAADAVVFVMPEIGVSVPGAFMNALDWLAAVPACSLAGKPVAIQVVSTGSCCTVEPGDHLCQIVRLLNAILLDEPRIGVASIDDKVDPNTSCLSHEETRRLVRSQLRALAALVRTHRNQRS